MFIEIRHKNGILFDTVDATEFTHAIEVQNKLEALLLDVADKENTFVYFTEFVTQGFIDESLDGLPFKDNIDTVVNAITQEAVDFFNLDDEDKIHYENARELDILKDTVADTVKHMQSGYLGEHDDLKSYIREDLDDKFDIPYFVMICVDMDKLCDTYECDHNYTFINGYLYEDVED